MTYKIAILDDYQHAAFSFADWTTIRQKADTDVFSDHLSDAPAIIERLKPYHVVCIMRERTPLPRAILENLPNLKLIISTGLRNASLDEAAAKELGIEVRNTGYVMTGAPELTWALLMAVARHIPQESKNVREGRWQTTTGTDLAGKTMGLIGLGRIGSQIARYATAFGMKVIAWSPNLTDEKAGEAGAERVPKERLLGDSDFVSVHLVLSPRSVNTLTEADLRLMKPTAYLINTSRGPLVDEAGLVHVLQEKRIAGAALDVFNTEPLPPNHPFRTLANVLATPHIGYVTEDTYRVFFRDTVSFIEGWLAGQ